MCPLDRLDIFPNDIDMIFSHKNSPHLTSALRLRMIAAVAFVWHTWCHWCIRLNCWLDSIAVLSSGGWCSWILRRHWKVSKKCPTSTTVIPDRFVEYVQPCRWTAPSHKQQYQRLASWVPIKRSGSIYKCFKRRRVLYEYEFCKIKEDIHHRLKDADTQIATPTFFESWMVIQTGKE